MREKQVVQLVKAGTLNAKLSAGGLVDIEYLVQGLQIAHGHRDPALRQTNTQQALEALHEFGLLSNEEYRTLVEAYIFQRRLIDALRMVRGHAKDLTVPEPESEEFEFLARRLGYNENLAALHDFDAMQHKPYALLERKPEARHAFVGDIQLAVLPLAQEDGHDRPAAADHIAVAHTAETRWPFAGIRIALNRELLSCQLGGAVEVDRADRLVRA